MTNKNTRGNRPTTHSHQRQPVASPQGITGVPPVAPNGEVINRWRVKFVDVHSSGLGAVEALRRWEECPLFLVHTWYAAREMASVYFRVQMCEVDIMEVEELYVPGVRITRKHGNGLIEERAENQ